MQAEFTIHGEPKGKGRPRFSTKSGTAYTPEATANYENLVKVEYLRQCGNVKFEQGKELEITITAYFSIPESKSKKAKEQMRSGMIRPTKKPDMDNIVKIIADSLNKIAYHDDSQIVDAVIRKYYSDNPRVVVKIAEIEKESEVSGGKLTKTA